MQITTKNCCASLNEFEGSARSKLGNFCYPLGFRPLIWQTDLSARQGRRKGRKEEGWIFRLPKTFSGLPSSLSIVVPFLFFQPALINEANQLAAAHRASERAEMGSLSVGFRANFPAYALMKFVLTIQSSVVIVLSRQITSATTCFAACKHWRTEKGRRDN